MTLIYLWLSLLKLVLCVLQEGRAGTYSSFPSFLFLNRGQARGTYGGIVSNSCTVMNSISLICFRGFLTVTWSFDGCSFSFWTGNTSSLDRFERNKSILSWLNIKECRCNARVITEHCTRWQHLYLIVHMVVQIKWIEKENTESNIK